MSTILQSAEQGTAGVVIWGDHHSEATKPDCIEIKNYIDNFLGPLVKSSVLTRPRPCGIPTRKTEMAH